MKTKYLIVLFLFLSTPIQGATYYVAKNGNDAGQGTEARPWLTIQRAADIMVSGDTAYIKAGIYNERVETKNSGDTDKYIIYAAYPGDTVTIDGTGIILPEWCGLFDITEKKYIKVSGFRVINSGPTLHNPGIQVDGSSHIIIEKNYTRNTSDSGIGVWNSNNIIVDNNEVEEACYNGYNECISVGVTDIFEIKNNFVHDSKKEGITAKDGSSNGKVFGNRVHHTDAVGIYIDAQDKHTYNIEVFSNTVNDTNSNGFALASEQGGLLENITVYNNISYNNKWTGIVVSNCCVDSHPISNIKIINNTFYNNGKDPWGGGILLENPQAKEVIIRNNISSRNLTFQIAVDDRVPKENFIIDHNLIDGSKGDEGGIYGDNYIEGDPIFKDPAGNNFHLQKGSPAIDKGSPANAPVKDFDGNPRPDGKKYDIGAFEE